MKELFVVLNKCLCDYRCIFCSRGPEDDRLNVLKNIQNFDYNRELIELKGLMLKAFNESGIRKLKIGGNEPLNHPRIMEIVSSAKDIGYSEIIIQTSGIRFADTNFVSKMVKSGLTHAEIPVYGSTAKVHDEIVGMRGSYEIISKSMENLRKAGIEVNNHTVLLKQNAKDIPEIIDKLKLKYIRFPHPSGNDVKNYGSVCVRLKDIDIGVRKKVFLKIPCITGLVPDDHGVHKVVRFNPDKEAEISRTENDTKKKSDRCKPCKYFDSCEGMFTLYLDLYGDSELNPIKNNALDKIACYIKR